MTMPASIVVHLDDGTTPRVVGTAYFTVRRRVLTTRFRYADSYLGRPDAWAISPDLPLRDAGGTTIGLPGALEDTAPDRWGRNLIRKRRRADADGGADRSMTDVDYLLGVSDRTRQGALRYTVGEGPFIAEGSEVPKLVELPTLLHAAQQVAHDDDDAEAIKVLLDAGSASLGGARPKASVRDGERLLLAKFSHLSDEWDVMAWEATALDIASAAGIPTPAHRLTRFGAHAALILDRFDRTPDRRIGYISAMTLAQSHDGVEADYLELAEAISDHGSHVRTDLRSLWRRIAFAVQLNNTDDHLRNLGFLHQGNGWTLAPVFDQNPNPETSATHATSLAGATGRAEMTSALFETSTAFELSQAEAARIWDEVGAAMSAWRGAASKNGIRDGELRRFAEVLDQR